MADPKYANLPGIDLDQPDVYETTELPEDDQGQDQEEDNDDGVEKLNVSATEAFGRFRGKGLDSGKTDFSDRVSRSRRTGYDIPQTEYEMAGELGSKETPQQKYQRLQHEIRELADEVHQVQESVKADSSAEKLSPVPMAQQVEYLQQQLTDLHLDKLLGPQGVLNLSDPQGALQKRLMTELDAFKPAGLKPGNPPSTGPTSEDGSCVTYQLYYKPEQAKFSHNARMADVEQRLERLESVVGNNPDKLSALTADTSNKSLVGAIAILTAKTKLLDPSQLDQVEGRLTALGQKLTQVAEKKEAIQEVDKQGKISELYDLVKKWDTVADSLPQVVERLVGLKDLHEQALQFSQSLTHLDTAQQQITAHLQSHGDMLKEVQKTLGDNTTAIKGNIEGLDNRIKALNK